MNRHLSSLLALAALVLFSCSTPEEPYQDEREMAYDHSFDLMWEQIQLALRKQYTIETLDEATRTITTDWNVHLAPFAESGYRTRLVVNLDGDIGAWKVKVREDTEINTEQVNPLSAEDAEWEKSESEGGTAGRFLVSLHRQ
ncbi:MAG: hypothetical protein KDB53_02825, partial [Planctomycetes bacterium]|nr:hypothetical protein [Planctomycetota bacterium]